VVEFAFAIGPCFDFFQLGQKLLSGAALRKIIFVNENTLKV
jgi:hypothetical protein